MRASLLLAVATLLPRPAAADELPAEAYERLRAAFVEVLADGHLEGSGWIAEAEGVVVTAAHVVGAPGRRLELRSPRLGRLAARVIAVDRGNDAALLRLPARDGGYPAVPLAAKVPPVSTRIHLLGSPVFRHALLLGGTVAAPEDVYEFMGFSGDYVRIRPVSGSGPPGTSGGPWADPRGEVVGLNSGLMRDGSAPNGIGFMVPVEAIRSLLREKRSPATPSLGGAFEEIWEQPLDYLRRYPAGTEGLVLRVLRKEGPAAAAGMAEGQLVVAIDGRPLRLRDEALQFLRLRKPGDAVNLQVRTPAGELREHRVTLADLEADWAATR